MLSGRETTVSSLVTASFNKRWPILFFVTYDVVSILSDGQGGEGEEMCCSAVIGLWRGRPEILEPVSPSTVLQGWRRLAVAILG